ncbi:PLP-dependent aminotransferase family protein [Allopusillimonas ginsengisoli]|uniref:MocR-like pyridoxine biosynthesis transcription factor PdxR n=1 Tax=Allopusillimonas ginsengisoli TaxID=453575 RepID=UPI001431C8CF|nr:PLP-dependent aminotransferase family protein [Allopusillimonas ginsengisoli]
MQLPLCLDMSRRRNLQRQLFEQIRELIIDGRLKPGVQLPASRVLAQDLGVSRNTVIQAYGVLVAEGYLEMRPPVGTFVAAIALPHAASPHQEAMPLPPPSPPRLLLHYKGKPHVVMSPYPQPVAFDFWVGRPDARLFPILNWARSIKKRLRYLQDGNSGYGDPAGLWDLRKAIADYVGVARGVQAEPCDVLVVNGIQEGLSLMAQLFIGEGTGVVVENPCYMGAANVFASRGARLLPVSVDTHGLCVDELPESATLAYLTPSHQYPTGATLSMARRERLLEWAQSCNTYILEDDYDSDFYYDQAPLPALKSQDESGHVIYMGTFSKSLGAGLRIGYLVLPRHLFEHVLTAKCLLNNSTVWLIQALLADFLATGAYRQHLHQIRMLYAARRSLLACTLLQEIGGEVTGIQSGMHLVWHVPPSLPEASELEQLARAQSVGVYSFPTGNAQVFGRSAERRYARALMMGYAALQESEIQEGVRRLSRLVG